MSWHGSTSGSGGVLDNEINSNMERLQRSVTLCRRCPRLVGWREQVAREKRAAFAGEEYWGRPVPAFGDPEARILVVGLAPAAHGANRTGRMFTGDRSGEWLYRALYRAGLANQPESHHRGDGLRLKGVWVTAGVRCAPPANKPTPAERDACAPFIEEEVDLLLPGLRVAVALGAFGWGVLLRSLQGRMSIPTPRPRFGHGQEVLLAREGGAPLLLLGSYHPSQQNTFTGTLTEEMFDQVWGRAASVAGMGGGGGGG